MPNIKGIVLFHLIYEAYKPIFLTLCITKMQKKILIYLLKGLYLRYIMNACKSITKKKNQFFKWVENVNYTHHYTRCTNGK